uniref:Uncharacterized protein n=1 Tax=Anguilla anguilla TaxID=7936 RepID=A0A0E9RU88_ANGAN
MGFFLTAFAEGTGRIGCQSPRPIRATFRPFAII